MPSASAKLEKQASQEALDPFKQVLTMIEHKKRNLEKRKAKLETYREEQKNGKELKGEQLLAVSKYDEVCRTLEFAVDMAKQVQAYGNDHAKALKKQQRKEQVEKTQNELSRIRELLIIQDVMTNMGNDTVRNDFLTGKEGAVTVTQEELTRLDDLYPMIVPKREEGTAFSQQVVAAADHLLALMEGRNKECLGTTYTELKNLVQRINNCGYFESNSHKLTLEFMPGQEVTGEEVTSEAIPEDPAIIEKELDMSSAAASATIKNKVPPQPTETLPPQQPTAAPAPTPATAAQPTDPASYYSGHPAAPPTTGGPQYAGMPQQPIPPNTMPHRPMQQPNFPEALNQPSGKFHFLQESQLDSESTAPSNVDLAVMLQYPAAGGVPPSGLPPGRNPAAPAASAVPQPEFNQTQITSQTFTNQSFSTMPSQAAATAPAPANPTPSAHIPGYAPQQASVATGFLPAGATDVPPPIPMPPRVVEEQTKMAMAQQQPPQPQQQQQQQQTNVMNPPPPASFAQAATYNNPKPYSGSAPPGFGPPQKVVTSPQPPAQQSQSQFQPIPSIEQAAEMDRAAEEQNTWTNDGDGEHGSGFRGGFRGRGGRGGRGRGGRGNSNSGDYSGRPRGGQQNGGGRSGGYQGGERSYENGVPNQRDYGSGGYKRGGASRDNSGMPSRGGQGNRGSNAPFRGGSSGQRGRGGGLGGNMQSRPQQVRQ